MLWNVQYDRENNIRIIKDNDNQVGLKMSRENARSLRKKKGEVMNVDNAVKIANDFMKDIIDIDKYTITEKVFNEITEVYSISYYYLVDEIITQDYCFVDVDSYGNVISYAAPYVGTCDELCLTKINRDDVIDKAYNKITDEQKKELLKTEVKDMIVTKDDNNAVVMVVYMVLYYRDGSMMSTQYDVLI